MTNMTTGKVIQRSWMDLNGLRLDSGPYLSGAFEARVALERLQAKKEPLHKVTLGGLEGIINAGRFPRTWVNDLNYGIPFLSSTDILQADLSRVSLIAKSAVAQNKKLLIREGWTLITRSGTIGRMVYSRPDMDGLACTEDVLRVIPDPERIPPGYLYAYLSSRYGVPMIVSGTYGAVIQHIEPRHIADLPVPRLGEAIEREAHNLVSEAARLRAEANLILEEARDHFSWLTEELPSRSEITKHPSINYVGSSNAVRRLDASYHNYVADSLDKIVRRGQYTTIGEFCSRVFLPGIFKRIYVDDIQYGEPYYTGASLYWIESEAKGYLARHTRLFNDVQLSKGTILVQAFGQDDGLVGRPVWVGKHLHNATTTHMLVRLNCTEPEMSGYLFAYIDSMAGYRQIVRLTYGGSIPHFDTRNISGVPVPLTDREEMVALSKKVLTAFEYRDLALDFDIKARRLIEHAIQETT